MLTNENNVHFHFVKEKGDGVIEWVNDVVDVMEAVNSFAAAAADKDILAIPTMNSTIAVRAMDWVPKNAPHAMVWGQIPSDSVKWHRRCKSYSSSISGTINFSQSSGCTIDSDTTLLRTDICASWTVSGSPETNGCHHSSDFPSARSR